MRRRALGQRVRIAAARRLGAAELRELNRIGLEDSSDLGFSRQFKPFAALSGEESPATDSLVSFVFAKGQSKVIRTFSPPSPSKRLNRNHPGTDGPKEDTMRVRMSLLVWIHLVVAAFGQDYYPRKDAAFGQVAVGGEIETVINLTNRGTFAYTGTVRFFRGKGNTWNPLVNGNTILNGTYPLEIPAQIHHHPSDHRESVGKWRGRGHLRGSFSR